MGRGLSLIRLLLSADRSQKNMWNVIVADSTDFQKIQTLTYGDCDIIVEENEGSVDAS